MTNSSAPFNIPQEAKPNEAKPLNDKACSEPEDLENTPRELENPVLQDHLKAKGALLTR